MNVPNSMNLTTALPKPLAKVREVLECVRRRAAFLLAGKEIKSITWESGSLADIRPTLTRPVFSHHSNVDFPSESAGAPAHSKTLALGFMHLPMNAPARGTPGEGTGPTRCRQGPLTRRFGFTGTRRELFREYLAPTPAMVALLLLCATGLASAAKRPPAKGIEVTYPPALPGGKSFVSDKTKEFLTAPDSLQKGVAIAKTPPTVDLLYYPGQTYAGKPWSVWGDSLAVNGRCYSAIGDHLAPQGNAFVFEYDPTTRKFRQLTDVKKLLGLPAGHYMPGKIHSRIDLGSDGWLYFSTHRGSTKVTTDEFHYTGDWILRAHPASGKSEIVARGAVPKHCLPASVMDPKRMIFYAGSAPGSKDDPLGIQFLAYDVRKRKVLYSGPDGPARALMFSPSTGRIYFNPEKDDSALMRFDPDKGGPPVRLEKNIGVRAASAETPQGIIYTVSQGQGGSESTLFAFNPKTESVEELAAVAVGTQQYVTSLDADPTGRFLYYVPGAHGGAEKDGTPIVQFDIRTKTRKVLAFLEPFYTKNYGVTLRGTYGLAVDPAGDKLYITWNANRGSRAWDTCALTVIHIPKSER